MPRKSSSVAARYAKSSKRKKAKKRSPTQAPQQTPAGSTSKVLDKPTTKPPIPVRSEPSTTVSATSRAPMQEVVADYSYVVEEMQKVAIVAGLMFAIIIALAFVLR
jgi:hypothetical protein